MTFMPRLAPERYFYPRPPRGGRPLCGVLGFHGLGISIHALREEGDREQAAKLIRDALFLSTPSARRATAPVIFVNVLDPKFLSTPSARRATDLVRLSGRGWFISIHALREEGDTVSPSEIIVDKEISIHALREEGDTVSPSEIIVDKEISIHALREEGDPPKLPFSHRPAISIHALREEGDLAHGRSASRLPYFYPRPPRGGRLAVPGVGADPLRISIHALREEGDFAFSTISTMSSYFYPRPPRGGRRTAYKYSCGSFPFLSTPSARRATPTSTAPAPGTSNFYPRPPRGGRLARPLHPGVPQRFLSTPSARRATVLIRCITGVVGISIHALREEGDLQC